MKTTVLILSCCAFSAVSFAERQPFDRYQSIVDRQMFGALPPGFDPTKLPSEVSRTEQKELTQEQAKLQSSIHFSVINVTPDGATAVGFTDNSDPKSPIHYYLKVGEKRNGWEVKEADAESATMTIAKEDIEVTLSLGGNSAKGGGTTAKGGGSRASADAGSARSGLLGGGSLRARRKLREQQAQEAQQKAAEAAAERENARQEQAEAEKAQREAERAEQRQQLQAIQEELKRVREAKSAAEKNGESSSGSDQNDES